MFETPIKYYFLALLFVPGVCGAQANQAVLKEKINHIIDTAGGKVGVGVQGVDFEDSFVINGERGYPMMSVFKFPLALALLQQVDKGKLRLDQIFHLPKEKLDTNTWSPMVKDFPGRDLDMTLSELLSYAVTKSDNNACDFLYGVAGGTAAVNAYIHRIGVKDISIVYTEGEMDLGWSTQYKNWCKPAAMLRLLRLLYHQQLLSKQSNDFLVKIMTEVPGGSKRITALLPPDTELIHKTGSSGINKEGILAALNDVGIVTLPNGKHLAIVVFASDFKGPKERGEHIIAAISKEIWDYYTSR
ncbi:MAG TPA: class A beta-lactamase, subclass A2 [Puia sp.]|jgi:beta-lactamase class A|nr:class A beta-lactamase, subclass A2 [Puia sp.]